MLLDTSGLFCLLDRTEPRHLAAVTAYSAARTRLTHGYVLAEFVALATARKLPRGPMLQFLADLLGESRHRSRLAGARGGAGRPGAPGGATGQGYSLCDGLSFCLMRERGLTEALTTDRHFDQEGVVRLLASGV